MNNSAGSPCVLLISNRDNVHVGLVTEYFERWKVNFFRLNVDKYPKEITVSFDPISGEGELKNSKGKNVLVQDITSCWYYHLPEPNISSKIKGKSNREFAVGEAKAGLGGLWRILDNRFWINHPKNLSAGALYKLKQLEVARKVGFEVPRSLVTNDPEVAERFFDNGFTKVILKMMGSPPEVRGMPHVFTTIVTRNDIQLNRDSIKLTPILFQEFIEKKFEMRITIVGRDVFPAALYTQDDPKARVDWKLGKLTKFKHEKLDLPLDIKKKCLQFMESLNLVYGAIDLIVTPEGKYFFLEVNPSGAWGWVEKRANLPVSESIARLLVRARI